MNIQDIQLDRCPHTEGARCHGCESVLKGWVHPYIFTFGFRHTHPRTGESLAQCFIRSPDGLDDYLARLWMIHFFGRKWAFQYSTEDEAGVAQYGLREVTL